MSSFEPLHIQTICARTLPSSEQSKFKDKWNSAVMRRTTGWKKARKSQSTFEPQLKYDAECTAYTDALWDKIRPTKPGGPYRALPLDWPYQGPKFCAPTFTHYLRRQVASECNPEWSYIKDVMIIHQAWFPFITRCPHCRSCNVQPNGWTSTGHREVHGLYREECVLGVQFRCVDCAAKRGSSGSGETEYCFSTTNSETWQQMVLWEIPRGVPHFFYRSAVTSELFDFIVECRLAENSAAIAEHVKQLHLLEYHRTKMEYLQSYQVRSQQTAITKMPELRNYSAPQQVGKELNGYDGTSITDDMVADVYARFSEARQKECEEHLRTLTATTLSLDATFRTAAKASFVNDDRSRSSIFNGGLHTAVNQKSLIIAYRWCLTLLHSEIGEMLLGLKRRFELLDIDNPWAVVVDNCCHFRNMIIKVFPEAVVLQDVWHLIMRYMICVLGGTRNPHRAEVAEDISSAIIKTKAQNGIPARYWTQEEQEERLVKSFEKWAMVGGVWSAAAEKTHHEQLEHIRKGCLTRPREDVATDGSRIEGTHKGWNALQRTHPSGVEVLTALAADHVLRHNIRVDYAHTRPYPFTTTTFGSHHIGLIDACGQLWNSLLDPINRGRRPPADLLPVPVLRPAASQESFGLVKANTDFHTYHSLVAVKEELDDSLVNLSSEDPEEAERIVRSLGVDPRLLHQPLQQDPGVSSTNSADQVPSRRSTITFVPAATTLEVIDVDIESSSDAPPSQRRPSAVPGSPKKRQASMTLSRTYKDPTVAPSADVSAKRTCTLQSDAPSSSAPFASTSSAESTPSGPAASPSLTASAASLVRRLPSFFSQCRLDASTPDPSASPICLPVPAISGTTRSQIIVSVVTGLDPRSLKFPRNDSEEFFLFMDLCARHRWITYNMSALGWVEATSIYNSALEEKKGDGAIRKTPRALMEKLEEIEKAIHLRLKNNDFVSRSGSTTFWQKHCLAVDLSAPGKRAKGKGKLIAPAKPMTRKPNTCHRCLSIMWAGGEGGGDNHKKGYCSDGVRQKPTTIDGVIEELPPWPQPNDIFTKGTQFWPQRFNRTIRELYDTITEGNTTGGPKAMEFAAFAEMLRARLIVTPATETQPSCVRFKLYRGLQLGEQPSITSDVAEVDGVKYLHVAYLSEAGYQEVAALH